MANRAHAAKSAKKQSLELRTISDIPAVVNPKRKAKCSKSLKLFMKTYLPQTFSRPMGPMHDIIIGKIEEAIETGSSYGLSAARGFGKSSCCEAGILWACLTGRSKYAIMVCSSDKMAKKSLESISKELESNDLIYEDWPSVCHPIRELCGIANRCAGQMYKVQPTAPTKKKKVVADPKRPFAGVQPSTPRSFGEMSDDVSDLRPTEIEFGSRIVFPACADFQAVVEVVGVSAKLRGRKYKNSKREVIRPDLVLCDDLSDHDAAYSRDATDKLESILTSSIACMSGFDRRIALLYVGSVICPGDLTSRILDHKLHPEFQGQKIPMILKFGPSEKWSEYVELRKEMLLNGTPNTLEKAFYKKNRAEMDEGYELSFPAQKLPDELSGIQCYYNLIARLGRDAVDAEYMCSPREGVDVIKLEMSDILSRQSKYSRGECPPEADWIVAFIDSNLEGLHWAVCSFTRSMVCNVLAYGRHPNDTDTVMLAGMSEEQSVGMRMVELLTMMGSMQFKSGERVRRLDGIMCDAGWQTQTIVGVVRSVNIGVPLAISFGRSNTQYKTTARAKKSGVGWDLKFSEDHKCERVLYSADLAKYELQRGMKLPVGTAGAVQIYGVDKDDIDGAKQHRAYAKQVISERLVSMSGGKYVWETDNANHLLDATAGCWVCAKVYGAGAAAPVTPAQQKVNTARKPRGHVSYSEV